MSAIPMIMPVTELRRDATTMLDIIKETGEPVVITQRGYPRAVLQDIDEYQLLQRKLEIAELLAAGEADIRAGNTVDSDEVMDRMFAFVDAIEAAAQ